ncbi:MAG: hypothetical protein HQL34_05555, partial [Alphaproteobacteria bacterium]|nr:hypothetical protein [Alphaproteobacteria bacterium]
MLPVVALLWFSGAAVRGQFSIAIALAETFGPQASAMISITAGDIEGR